ncbi:MAG: GNAT family N-acetyltransferase [Chloroflexi bacterium]|nr:GNAT family N-acetyltransferase [Chloroflexota bacterium]MCI0580601.1 GNAT family N-acetyltransferase [Chloroflexota bacterium]MCI0648877.1 GNAT family N-acetyltransferase [Chloroflexota bacterium]MCI0728207.1 GNAT family N-acetyltransferase [Chloroflexota bacterium]
MLKGQKVLLRATKREDMLRQWEFENDPEMWFWDGGTPRPASLEQLLADFDQNAGKGGGSNVSDDSALSFAIEADGKYIGHCGLHHFDEVGRSCELSVEIGDKAYWGQGYGRDVVQLLLDYAFRHRNMNRVWLKTHSENERAIRCYRACGFVEEARLRQHIWIDGRYVDRVIMGLLREEVNLTEQVRVYSPRLAHPEQAVDFKKEIIEAPSDDGGSITV